MSLLKRSLSSLTMNIKGRASNFLDISLTKSNVPLLSLKTTFSKLNYCIATILRVGTLRKTSLYWDKVTCSVATFYLFCTCCEICLTSKFVSTTLCCFLSSQFHYSIVADCFVEFSRSFLESRRVLLSLPLSLSNSILLEVSI